MQPLFPRSSWFPLAGLVALFVAIGFLVYGQNLFHTFTPFDDDNLIYGNVLVQNAMSPSTLVGSFTRFDPELYVPLTFISYQIDAVIGGIHPWIFHLTNLLLHIANALLVMWVGWLLARKRWIAVAMGLLFLVHPLHTEAVAWAAARKDVLSAFFFLGSFVAFLLYREHKAQRYFRFGLELFVLALLSKVMAVTLPAVLLLLWIGDGRIWQKKMWIDLVPVSVLAVIFLLVGFFGKSAVVTKSTLVAKGLMAFKSTWFYLTQLVWPSDIRVLYYQQMPIHLNAEFLVPILCVLGFLCLAAGLWRNKKTHLIAFGMLFYIVTLVPTFLGTDRGGSVLFASDRYAYIPSVGIFLALCVALDRLFVSGKTHRQMMQTFLLGAGVLIVCELGSLSFLQARTWQDGVTLFTRVLSYNPHSLIALQNRGVAFITQNKPREAYDDFHAAVMLDPTCLNCWVGVGDSLRMMHRFPESLDAYEHGMQLDMYSAHVHLGLGRLFKEMGREKDAHAAFYNAYMIDPGYVLWSIGLDPVGLLQRS